MSVSDPYIKDIKGCILNFMKHLETHESIPDNNFFFLIFAHRITKIFKNGFITQQNTAYFNRKVEVFSWMSAIVADENNAIVNYAYRDCVDKVKETKNVFTNEGKFRLLVRHCLVRKCLHVPVEYLIRTKKSEIFYTDTSIIGNEILSEILLSALLQCSKLKFSFNVDNSAFLDDSWVVPEIKQFEVVPCKFLGCTIRFVSNKAIIIAIAPSSVADETDDIKLGDVIDKINGVYITGTKSLSVLDNNKGLPITLTIVKAFNTRIGEGSFYGPIEKILKDIKINLEVLRKQYQQDDGEACAKKCYGTYVKYLGFVDVGSNGSVKFVEKAIRSFLSTNNSYIHRKQELTCTVDERNGCFEIGEMGVKVKDIQSEETFLEHFYLNISSCGTAPYMPYNFGYIAGEESCETAKNFKCYIFRCDETDDVEMILRSISQGFQRTHFAV